MNEIYLTKVNGVNLAVVNGSDEQLVPMKPICEALGITLQSQLEKLKNHPLFTSTIRLSLTVGADGKEREMACIPLSHLTGWMVTIHPSNVKEEVRERLVEFQNECVKVLHEYFFGDSSENAHVDILSVSISPEMDISIKQILQSIMFNAYHIQ